MAQMHQLKEASDVAMGCIQAHSHTEGLQAGDCFPTGVSIIIHLKGLS